MQEHDRVKPSQMAALLLSFTTGSTIIFIPSPVIGAAGNGAWLSFLLSGAIGIILTGCVLFLHQRYPASSMVQFYEAIFGKWIAAGISILFIIVLILMAANVTLGLSSFFSITMMVDTKPYLFHFLILLSAALTAHAGIEIMARMFTLMLVFTYFTIAVILLCLLPLYDPWMLLPQLNEGIKPILHGAYIGYGFPYSEIYVFAPLMCFINTSKKEPLGRFMIYAAVINVATMIAVSLCAFMVMGESAGTRKFVLYSMARLLEIPGIVERVESIAGITLIAGSFIKATIAIFSLSVTFSRLIKSTNTRLFVFPLTGLIFFLSMTMFPNEAEAMETWNVVWPLISSTCAIPIVIAVIGELVRKKGTT